MAKFVDDLGNIPKNERYKKIILTAGGNPGTNREQK